MLKNLGNAELLIVALLIVIGILVAVVFIIKRAAVVVATTNKFVYWSNVIPIFVIFTYLAYGREWIRGEYDVHIPDVIILIALIVFFVTPLIRWICRVGVINGICFFLVQVVTAFLLLCLAYASLVLMVLGVALVLGGGFIDPGNGVCIMAIGFSGEIKYVIGQNDGIWLDREGQKYIQSGEYWIRLEDNEYFKRY